MTKNIFRFLFVFCFAGLSNVSAQINLVLNPSFEDVVGCPSTLNLLDSANNWFNPTNSSPDLFLTCTSNINQNGVPNNIAGYQQPVSGYNYAGFGAEFYPTNASGREYLTGTLSDSLTANTKYRVEMYVSLAFIYSCFYQGFGIFFAQSYQEYNTTELIPATPQVTFDTLITDTVNWVLVQDTFVANGGEKFFTIGLFSNNENTLIDTIYYDTLNPSLVCYFFVDDVSVTLIEDPPSPPPPSYPEINIFPNPSTDGIFTLQYEFDTDGVLEIYNTLGQIIFKRNLPPGAVQEIIDLSDRASGAYYYRVIKNEQQIKTGKLVISE